MILLRTPSSSSSSCSSLFFIHFGRFYGMSCIPVSPSLEFLAIQSFFYGKSHLKIKQMKEFYNLLSQVFIHQCLSSSYIITDSQIWTRLEGLRAVELKTYSDRLLLKMNGSLQALFTSQYPSSLSPPNWPRRRSSFLIISYLTFI